MLGTVLQIHLRLTYQGAEEDKKPEKTWIEIYIEVLLFQTVYECVDKITQFMSRAAIFSFLPVLTKVLVPRVWRKRSHFSNICSNLLFHSFEPYQVIK
jgi:hypothetical protein